MPATRPILRSQRKLRLLPGILKAICLSMIPLTATSQQVTDSVSPESTIAQSSQKLVTADKFMVATAHPIATQTGYSILKQGGNAIDAMVAVQAMLGLVEPQSSGLGGGAFLVYYDANSKSLTTFDGRETAPIRASESLFLNKDGKPLGFFEAVVGGRSVGTPGTVKLMWDTHKSMGNMSWSELLAPAIDIATRGFNITPRLHGSIQRDAERLASYPTTKNYFLDETGEALPVGYRLKNPDYAATLELLVKNGGDYFYSDAFAQRIVDAVTTHPSNPGVLSPEDFKRYKIIERKPVCAEYRGYDICGMGPPSSGALAVGQTLGILNHFDLKSTGTNSYKSWHLISEASRLAFADRGKFVADTDFVPLKAKLLNKSYLRTRAKLISMETAMEEAEAGDPPGTTGLALSPGISFEQPSTTHFVIVDEAGKIASMTSTIENGFGSRVMVGGFLLNNELTDFSFAPKKDGALVANRVEPGKRPRSSMAPTLVMKNKQPYLAIGSPGGSRIINYVTNTIIAHLDWGLDIQTAINQPHVVKRFNTVDIEVSPNAETLKTQLEKLGHQTKIRDLNSGLHAVLIEDGKLFGAADPRREGLVMGD